MRLFLNDLDDLVRLLREQTAETGLRAGDATADEPEDLREATRAELRAVQLVTTDPAVVVRLGDSAVASTVDQGDNARLLVDDICGLLAPRRSRLAAMRSYWREAGVITVALGLAIVLGIYTTTLPPTTADSQQNRNGTWVVAGLTIGLYAVLVFRSARRARRRGYCMIVLERRGERRGLSQRTRLELISGLLGALIAAAVAIAIAVAT